MVYGIFGDLPGILSVTNPIAGFWAWCLENHVAVRLISSVLFGTGGLALGVASILLTYRSNRGWKPIVMMTTLSHTSTGTGEVDDPNAKNTMSLVFEVWNRRPYPVAVHEIQVSLGNHRVNFRTKNDEWLAAGNGNLIFIPKQRPTLAAGAKEEFVADTDIMDGEDKDGREMPFEVWVDVYDPIRSRLRVIHRSQIFGKASGLRSWFGKRMPRRNRRIERKIESRTLPPGHQKRATR